MRIPTPLLVVHEGGSGAVRDIVEELSPDAHELELSRLRDRGSPSRGKFCVRSAYPPSPGVGG